MDNIDSTWFLKHLRGREELADLTVVEITLDRVRSLLAGMHTQPMMSALSLRTEAVWQRAIDEARGAFAPGAVSQDLSAFASAALFDILCNDDEVDQNLEVHPSFSGRSLAQFAFGPVLKTAAEAWSSQPGVNWTNELFGVRLAPPYCLLLVPSRAADHLHDDGRNSNPPLDARSIASLLNGDEYTARVYEQYLARLAELLASEPLAGRSVAIVPRISSPVCAVGFREELDFGEKYLRSVSFVQALGASAQSVALDEARHLSDPLLALLADFALEHYVKEADRDNARAVIDAEPLRSRIQTGHSASSELALGASSVRAYYRDALEEFILLALFDLDEVDDEEDEEDEDGDDE
ncbi:MAG: hypothetical protein IPK13_24235 [Deltaproteobacteria bacterium]|nr:hypothetical protein [Deltaproteobacteria bacterium]